MKKSLLVSLFASGIIASGQNFISEDIAYPPVKGINDAGAWAPYSQTASKVANLGITIGNGGNAYGIMFDAKTYLWVHPSLNVAGMVYRSTPSITNDVSTGSLRYGFSTNKGLSWNINQGPLWNPTPSTEVARYPQGGLFNPAGNSNPDSVYVVFFAPVLDNSNSNWGGIVVGSSRASDNANLNTTRFSSFTPDASFAVQVPNDFYVNNPQQKVFGIAEKRIGTAYDDTLVLTVGTWNNTSKSFTWTNQYLHCPMGMDSNGTKQIADAKIAFGPDGQVGYIGIIGYSGDTNFSPVQAFHPLYMKTTNGGQTWTGPFPINLQTLQYSHGLTGSVLGSMQAYGTANGWTINHISTAFNIDVVVDANNNPHFGVNINPAAVSTLTSSGGSGSPFSIYSAFNFAVDIYSPNGGSTWSAIFMDTISFFRGLYGSGANLAEDNRIQLSRSENGEYIVMTWGDTDFDLWGSPSGGNVFPDVKARGFRVQGNNITLYPIKNFMDQDLNYKGAGHQHCLSHFLIDSTSAAIPKLRVPVVVQEYQNGDIANDLLPVTYKYFNFEYTWTATSTNEFFNSLSNLRIFPNPSNRGPVQVIFENSEAGYYQLEITDITGKIIQSSSLGFVGEGIQRTQVNTADLASGVYLINVRGNSGIATQRMIVR
ncbi:T9SS type A sorting domain-containing protein [Schleiferia thermophila]|uniref:Putative secreted protein (Por secretion system target) n=2 Tax=Schleiferia thermophila TaxID=884107 RepID=A0A369A6I2_9FLAO|nr:T9SS type A sorting domain-containing protein [Schleiferia thermophila]RCX04960.1 putative secreted protein (Por secretion system target) [Schleiferia thermophila]